jgi:Tol biopolymer transport system component
MKLRILLFLITGSIIISCTTNQETENKKLVGNYLGQTTHSDSAIVFAEEIISTEFNERDATFSPDGNEFFYSLKGPSFYSLVHLIRKNGVWQKPVVASFSGSYTDIEPCFSPDGTKLFFVSTRPISGKGEPKDYDIWYVEKNNGIWANPTNIGLPVNTGANEFYPSFTKEGTLYFCAKYENGIGGEDLYSSEFKNGQYLTPVNLGDSVNSAQDEFNSFVSANGDFIMFTSMGWGTGFGGGDLWISFRKENNSWTKPKNMGEKVNSPFFEYCPSLTPNGKFLFFTSNRSSSKNFSTTPLTYNKMINGLNSIINGSQNIYWISTDFINGLNK